MQRVVFQRSFQRRQIGQSFVEYIVVTAALVAGLMHPITPPSGQECPNGAAKCPAVDILAQVMRNRYEGYSYAMSASENEPLVDYKAGTLQGVCKNPFTGKPCTKPSPGNPPAGGIEVKNDNGDVIGHAVGAKFFDKTGIENGTVDEDGNVYDSGGKRIGSTTGVGAFNGSGATIAVNVAGIVVGELGAGMDSGFVVVDKKATPTVRIGKKDPKSNDVWDIDKATSTVLLDADNKPIVIGHLGSLGKEVLPKGSGIYEVLDADGNKIGQTKK